MLTTSYSAPHTPHWPLGPPATNPLVTSAHKSSYSSPKAVTIISSRRGGGEGIAWNLGGAAGKGLRDLLPIY